MVLSDAQAKTLLSLIIWLWRSRTGWQRQSGKLAWELYKQRRCEPLLLTQRAVCVLWR